jgi:5'-deoxynucleotidase YfbR-like HD superfamily hydrolase
MEFSDLDLSQSHRLIKAIGDQSNIKRYALFTTIQTSTVAEHVGRVAMILAVAMSQIHAVVGDEGIKLMFYSLLCGCIHDLPESITGDIPFPVHRQVKELKYLDLNVADSLFRDLPVLKSSYALKDALVKSADMAELVMFVTKEIQLGNRTSNVISLLKRALDLMGDLNTDVKNCWGTIPDILITICQEGIYTLTHAKGEK